MDNRVDDDDDQNVPEVDGEGEDSRFTNTPVGKAMSDSEVEIVEAKENGEPIFFDMVKQKMLRDSARFIRNSEKIYKHHMAHEKWRKLVSLANILESNMTPAELNTKFPDEKIRKLELVWNCNDVIVIDDDEPSNKQAEEQSSGSTAKSTARSCPIYLDLTSPPPAEKSLYFERSDSVSTSIGTRQQDDMPIVYNISSVDNIDAASDSLVFSRPSNVAPLPTATADSSFHEARKRLAEITGTIEITASPYKPGEALLVLQSPPSPVPSPPSFSTNTPWSFSVGNSNHIPVMEFPRAIPLTSHKNNNNSQTYNMNLNNVNLNSGDCTMDDLPFDGSFNNSQNEPSMSRRYINLRDPRRAKCGNSNGPPTAATSRQQQIFNCNSDVINDINNNDSNNSIINNQMIRNVNNNHINPVIRNPNFGNRPVYNHTGSGNKNPHFLANTHSGGGYKEPRTYGEYRLAKRQRQLQEAERQRQLEAAEKQRQLDDVNEAAIRIDKDHLDTSYRNLELLNKNKRIDFKIPKKASLDRSVKLIDTETEPRVSRDNVDMENYMDDMENYAADRLSEVQVPSRHSFTLQETEPKSTAATAQNSLEVAWELATATKICLPIKRKKGRPLKKKQATATETSTSSVKRNRGRPPLLKKKPPVTEVSTATTKTPRPAKRKRGRPFKKQPPSRQTDDSSSQEDLGNVETEDSSFREDLGNVETEDSSFRKDPSHPTTALSANAAASTTPAVVIPTTATPLASPPPKRKVRRNEVDMLNDDIAEMYYGDDVLRATGRRACTTQKKKQPTYEPESRFSSTSQKSS
ncbi:hypothetical protein ACLKA6_019395 [Drosophila palustris]